MDSGIMVSGASGVAGIGGSLLLVSSYGSVSGLSAAGISSGLATVGGSMAGGLVVVGSLPLLATGAGYGLFRVCKRIRNGR